MKKILLLLIIAFSMASYFAYDLYQNKLANMDNESDILSQKQNFVRQKSDKPGAFLKYFQEISVKPGQESSGYSSNYRFQEFYKAIQKRQNVRTSSVLNITDVISRGPGNVGGRTRALILDPTDPTHKTWYAGSASGGIWLTTDEGQSWTNLTPDLPNLSTNSLAMGVKDVGGVIQKTIYAGTGELYATNYSFVRGDGIFKSADGGQTWVQLESTAGLFEFKSVNDLLVDPNNPDIVIAATNWGIYKSIDGGTSWSEVYKSPNMTQDLEADPNDFNIQYAAVYGVGCFKSVNGGDTWNSSSSGLITTARLDLSIAPSNTSRLFASTYNALDETVIYVSSDAGDSWVLFNSEDNYNFLGEQGWYDNIVAVNPYDENTFFVGGVYLGKIELTGEEYESDKMFTGIDLENTNSFLSFVNFSAPYYSGALAIGDGSNPSSSFFSVEIRFGGGRQQKAHRFTVPEDGGTNGDGGAGIADNEYEYQDYVSVPFEVWDIENNRQLMVSFRDQQRDGTFNLNPRDDSYDPNLLNAREYIFISNIPYSEPPDENIMSETAGHLYKNVYFFWPIAAPNFDWEQEQLPVSTMRINYEKTKQINGDAEIISDPRGDFGGLNSNLHADHHNLIMIPINEGAQDYWILNANDGGLGLSKNEGATWTQILDGYVTTQFYGADKKPKEDQYIGGMQDNGTWKSSGNATGPTAEYSEQLGGDGFEVIWHSTDPSKMLGSIYNNRIYRTSNGGNTWVPAQNGIDINNGPFITRLASSRERPETVFAVSAEGILRSTNFGLSWKLISIEEEWTFITSEGIPAITSQHDVKVSLSNPDIIWAGGGMYIGERKMFVSTDGGDKFNPVVNYPDANLGALSGLATHPTQDSTVYALFSYASSPKVLRTTDLGQTWEDISGFVTNNSVSSNGFPDVFVHSMLVMPHEPDVLWAGTEIGIFQSIDNGNTWSYLDTDFPAVSVWSMKVVDDQVVIATHGRGIWTITIPDLLKSQSLLRDISYAGNLQVELEVDIAYIYDSIIYYINGERHKKVTDIVEGIQEVPLTLVPTVEDTLTTSFVAYSDGVGYSTASVEFEIDLTPEIERFEQNEEPDPLTELNLEVEVTESYDSLEIYINDQKISVVNNLEPGLLKGTVTIEGPGEYAVQVIGYYGELAFPSEISILTVETITGILFSTVVEQNSLRIFPNPVTDQLSYEIPEKLEGNYVIRILDLSGKTVYQSNINNLVQTNRLTVSNLEKGVYIITVSGQDVVCSEKFIKK